MADGRSIPDYGNWSTHTGTSGGGMAAVIGLVVAAMNASRLNEFRRRPVRVLRAVLGRMPEHAVKREHA